MQLAVISSLKADFCLTDRKFVKNTQDVLFSHKKSELIQLRNVLFLILIALPFQSPEVKQHAALTTITFLGNDLLEYWEPSRLFVCYLRHFVKHNSCFWNNIKSYFCVVYTHLLYSCIRPTQHRCVLMSLHA